MDGSQWTHEVKIKEANTLSNYQVYEGEATVIAREVFTQNLTITAPAFGFLNVAMDISAEAPYDNCKSIISVEFSMQKTL